MAAAARMSFPFSVMAHHPREPKGGPLALRLPLSSLKEQVRIKKAVSLESLSMVSSKAG